MFRLSVRLCGFKILSQLTWICLSLSLFFNWIVSLLSLQMLLRSPLRWYTFRVMILTSLVWVIFGMCILVYYMECLAGTGVNCPGKQQQQYVMPEAAKSVEVQPNGGGGGGDERRQLFNTGDESWPFFRLPHYRESQLHAWKSPSKSTFSSPLVLIHSFSTVIKTNPSSWPGENGRGVSIPAEEEHLKNEKFKLNQFNLLASDRIALNRTISDVRLDG